MPAFRDKAGGAIICCVAVAKASDTTRKSNPGQSVQAPVKYVPIRMEGNPYDGPVATSLWSVSWETPLHCEPNGRLLLDASVLYHDGRSPSSPSQDASVLYHGCLSPSSPSQDEPGARRCRRGTCGPTLLANALQHRQPGSPSVPGFSVTSRRRHGLDRPSCAARRGLFVCLEAAGWTEAPRGGLLVVVAVVRKARRGGITGFPGSSRVRWDDLIINLEVMIVAEAPPQPRKCLTATY